MRPIVLALAAGVLWSPAAAQATTVSVGGCFGKYCGAYPADVRAGPGEANRILVTSSAPGSVTVTDTGAPITAGPGCTQDGAGAVRCSGVIAVFVDARDGDDEVEITGESRLYATRISGGPGDDLVTGSDGNDRLTGGAGRDRLLGRGGDDELDGDAFGARPEADVIDGGDGIDLVDYADRTRPIRLRLDASGADPAAGEVGERDRLAAVEGAHGGSGRDVIRAGDAGALPSTSDEVDGDTPGIRGGPGDDLLVGGPGDDRIDAAEGADRVRAGAGGDDVELPFARSRPGARVGCGRGYDLVLYAAPRDVLDGCERIYAGDDGCVIGPAPAALGGVRVLELHRTARVTVRLRDGRLVAHRRLRERPGRLRLTALGRSLARRRALPAIQVACGRRDGVRLAARRG
jgi:RTX calcium-binding nonapeptide repeat (4 copies)